jgi:hypothetical protein
LSVPSVPRIGDLVEIDVPVGEKESAVGSGRVQDVIWKQRHEGQEVTVILG